MHAAPTHGNHNSGGRLETPLLSGGRQSRRTSSGEEPAMSGKGKEKAGVEPELFSDEYMRRLNIPMSGGDI